jgi:hypothetical protein
MRTRWIAFLWAFLGMGAAGGAMAGGFGWSNHAPPLDFLFGNEIDTHQQTRALQSGQLRGFLYIKFTGAVTTDGYRIAQHVDCNQETGCAPGWFLRGQPGKGTFLYHVMGDHPVWLVDRFDIPQPGGHSHFHWLGPDHPVPNQPRSGFFLELTALDRFCFVHHEQGALSTMAASCKENRGVIITPGLDIASHVNIVTSFPP